MSISGMCIYLGVITITMNLTAYVVGIGYTLSNKKEVLQTEDLITKI